MQNRLWLTLASIPVAMLIASSPAIAQTEEVITIKAAPQEKPAIYDEKADAREQISAAVAKAMKENRRVLVQWGANWCGWCHLLHNTMKSDRELSRKVLYEYDVVLIDVGRFDKNIELATEFGADLKAHGLPYLTVLDGDGKVIANQDTGSLEKQDSEEAAHDVAKVMEFLTQHQATPLSAESVLATGIAEAKKHDKQVFLHFGAPWCGWCHRLEDWMALESVAPVLGKNFIDVKIDTDRMIGGQDALTEYTGGKPSGIPFFAILDGDGKVVVNSFAMPDGGNVGCPWTDEEKAIFARLLKEHTKIAADQVDAAVALLGPKEEAGR